MSRSERCTQTIAVEAQSVAEEILGIDFQASGIIINVGLSSTGC